MLVVTIDGPCGAGKSTIALLLARRLGYSYLDTGALYRAIALKAKKTGIPFDDDKGLEKMIGETELDLIQNEAGLAIFLDRKDVTKEIRDEAISMGASLISQRGAVRAGLLKVQRDFGRRGGVVAEGRDMGTVIFPDADIKFYLDATPVERGRRRYIQAMKAGLNLDFKTVLREMEKRDEQDTKREFAPLVRAPDAIYIDSTDMTVEEMLHSMLREIERLKGGEPPLPGR